MMATFCCDVQYQCFEMHTYTQKKEQQQKQKTTENKDVKGK